MSSISFAGTILTSISLLIFKLFSMFQGSEPNKNFQSPLRGVQANI